MDVDAEFIMITVLNVAAVEFTRALFNTIMSKMSVVISAVESGGMFYSAITARQFIFLHI